jgi:Domain of unknown function (DUF5615)
VKVLLDENVPLPLLRSLRASGVDAEHIIALGLRGISDGAIRARLDAAPFVFLTQDVEFLSAPLTQASRVLVSRVPQALPLARRIELWTRALSVVLSWSGPERLFELDPDGTVAPWTVHDFKERDGHGSD